MSWLKKLGVIILKATQIATGIGPILGGKAQTVETAIADKLTQIGEVVTLAEVFGQAVSTPLPGAEKLKAVTPAVAQIILTSSLVAGRKINDPVKFQAGAQQIAAGVADILNSLEDKVETTDKA